MESAATGKEVDPRTVVNHPPPDQLTRTLVKPADRGLCLQHSVRLVELLDGNQAVLVEGEQAPGNLFRFHGFVFKDEILHQLEVRWGTVGKDDHRLSVWNANAVAR